MSKLLDIFPNRCEPTEIAQHLKQGIPEHRFLPSKIGVGKFCSDLWGLAEKDVVKVVEKPSRLAAAMVAGDDFIV